VFTDGTLSIDGDTGVVQAFADLFRLYRSDWPARLSPVIGEAATSRIESFLDYLEDWRRQAGTKLATDMGDYLREEKRLLASREAVREFTDAVDELVSDASRLEQRIGRIERGRG
jgi:ubiquinone biosynthesis protein UbiJ